MLISAFITGGKINLKNMFFVLANAPEGVAMNYDALKGAIVDTKQTGYAAL